MTNEEIQKLAKEFATAINGTIVKAYDHNGDIWSFKLENVIDILPVPNKTHICAIILKKDSGTCMICESDGNIRVCTGSIITVCGSISKWKKMLNINIDIINSTDE